MPKNAGVGLTKVRAHVHGLQRGWVKEKKTEKQKKKDNAQPTHAKNAEYE